MNRSPASEPCAFLGMAKTAQMKALTWACHTGEADLDFRSVTPVNARALLDFTPQLLRLGRDAAVLFGPDRGRSGAVERPLWSFAPTVREWVMEAMRALRGGAPLRHISFDQCLMKEWFAGPCMDRDGITPGPGGTLSYSDRVAPRQFEAITS